MEKASILIVEDDAIIGSYIEKILTDLGYAVIGPVDSGEEAIQKAAETCPSLILMDIQIFGEMNGIETAEAIHRQSDIPVIYLTAYADDARLQQAKATLPYGYLIKPIQGQELHAAIEMALYKHKTDRKIKESEERYRAVMAQALDGMFLFNTDTRRIAEANTAFCSLLGYTSEEIHELALENIIGHDSIEQLIGHVLENRQYAAGEQQYRHKNGLFIDVIVNAALIPYAGLRNIISVVIHDITQLKRAEEARRQMEAHIHYSQKAESLGRMAGAVAHNFNNIMTTILGYSELIQSDMPKDSPFQSMLQEIINATMRATKITRQILEYTGDLHGRPQHINLSMLIREIAPLIEINVSKKIVVRYELADNLHKVSIVSNQIRQMMLNLISNASEAIGDKKGVITISTGVMEADRAFLSEPYLETDLPEGKYVTIDVSDTGCGMDDATKAKIFDPFFTTKFLGRGLGVPAVLGIVRQHRGAIKVFSSEGSGTTIKILLPIG